MVDKKVLSLEVGVLSGSRYVVMSHSLFTPLQVWSAACVDMWIRGLECGDDAGARVTDRSPALPSANGLRVCDKRETVERVAIPLPLIIVLIGSVFTANRFGFLSQNWRD